jgi:SpoVK/Ycf46/Vps4 family AAA+-type ATPase
MRILIYAIARTGSTTLGRYVANSFGYPFLSEPYGDFSKIHNKNHIFDTWDLSNVVVKTIHNQIDMIPEKIFEKFDKVIILTRENVKEQSLSFHYAFENNQFLRPYVLNNFKVDEVKLDNFLNLFEKYTNELLNLNGFHVTYEQIYQNTNKLNELDEYLEIADKKYRYMLNLENRYKKSSKSEFKLI